MAYVIFKIVIPNMQNNLSCKRYKFTEGNY